MSDFAFAFTPANLQSILPKLSDEKLVNWYSALASILPEYNINSEQRVAMFLAQTTHESADYTALHENLNYGAKGLMTTWPKRFDAAKAAACERKPELIANVVYSNRMGNGDEASGDGWKYRGRGILQITGHDNYKQFSMDTFGDDRILNTPDYLEHEEYAVKSACWFWKRNYLNDLSDKGDIKTVTLRINGGTHGIDDRQARYDRILPILKG
jgi:putative chitinase